MNDVETKRDKANTVPKGKTEIDEAFSAVESYVLEADPELRALREAAQHPPQASTEAQESEQAVAVQAQA